MGLHADDATLNGATVTYVIHMLHERCYRRREQAKQTNVDVRKKMYAVPQKGPPSIIQTFTETAHTRE